MQHLYPRLQQLWAELESSAHSPENGLSILYAIRRELLRHYFDLPYAQLMQCPGSLREEFYRMQRALQQAPAFPTPSASAQFAATKQALTVLTQVDACESITQRLGTGRPEGPQHGKLTL